MYERGEGNQESLLSLCPVQTAGMLALLELPLLQLCCVSYLHKGE